MNTQKVKTVILDSSVWIASLLTTDVNNLSAKSLFRYYFQNKYIVYVPDIIFYEVVSVLIKLGKYNLVKSFATLDLNITILSSTQFLNTILKYQSSFRTKTQDSLIIIHCLVYNVDCFETFDIKQKKNYDLIRQL